MKEARRIARRYAHRMTPEQSRALAERIDVLATALRERGDLVDASQPLGELLDGELRFARKSSTRQYVESLAGVVFVAVLFRSLVVQAYVIPSGSMIPTLQVGDHIFVNKIVYGVTVPFTDFKIGEHYRTPQRGEIIVFKRPRDENTDLIKRVIGVAGDVVEMHDDVVYVNGVATPREHVGKMHYSDFNEVGNNWFESDADAWTEHIGDTQFTTLHDSTIKLREFAPVKVPPNSLFVMGDNRDHSNDSRYWGSVPLDLVRGRAMFVWYSHGEPEGLRVSRFGHILH
ncbi:MAG TPA: signal peptidase I [Polyangia bacterium]|nr:signal peptidase I [Polyangia bacterium]